jgi:hypothetical protein
MKSWVGAATLLGFAVAGSVGPVDSAVAAKVITGPRAKSVHTVRYDRAPPDTRAAIRPYGEPYYAGGGYYYARPFFYIPAPFPLGFDFGFGW